jgi:hypothetical protein
MIAVPQKRTTRTQITTHVTSVSTSRSLAETTAATSFRKRKNCLHSIMVHSSEDVAEDVAGVICDCHTQGHIYVTILNDWITESTEAVKMVT